MKLDAQQIDAIRAVYHRHTPVADNHYPDVCEGDCVLHAYPSGENLWSVAVYFPSEEEEDPTEGLWWVLIPPHMLGLAGNE
jgi:hypothetical protein